MNGSGEMTMTNEELFKKVIKKYGLDNISEEEQKKFVEELNEIEKDIDKIRSMSFKYDKDEKKCRKVFGAMIELTTKDGKIEIDPNNIVEYKELPYGLRYIKCKTDKNLDEYIIYESMKEIMAKVRIKRLEDLLKDFKK
jgi:hypothetical protein